jgi:hypothetical protein
LCAAALVPVAGAGSKAGGAICDTVSTAVAPVVEDVRWDDNRPRPPQLPLLSAFVFASPVAAEESTALVPRRGDASGRRRPTSPPPSRDVLHLCMMRHGDGDVKAVTSTAITTRGRAQASASGASSGGAGAGGVGGGSGAGDMDGADAHTGTLVLFPRSGQRAVSSCSVSGPCAVCAEARASHTLADVLAMIRAGCVGATGAADAAGTAPQSKRSPNRNVAAVDPAATVPDVCFCPVMGVAEVCRLRRVLPVVCQLRYVCRPCTARLCSCAWCCCASVACLRACVEVFVGACIVAGCS